MPPLGTAPRLVGGQWRTRSGRVLSPAGQRYWSLKKAQGFTDGQGHVSRSSVVAGGRVSGMVTRGNIDIRHRPSVPTPGRPGMHSSVRSITVTDDQGRAHVIPTVIQEGGKWKVASKTEAIAHWRKTGQHLGVFSNEPAANRYASKLHEQQARTTAPRQPQTPRLEPAGPEPKKPGFSTIVAARAGDPAARRQVAAYGRHERAKKQAETQTNRMVSAQFGGAEQIAARANKVVNPAAGAVIKALSPSTALKETVSAARHGKVGPALLAASGILPVGPGRARALAKAVQSGEEATRVAGTIERGRRTLQVGEKVQQLPRARSSITQTLIEKPADKFSAKHPALPYAGAQDRVAKAAGRETLKEGSRANARFVSHVKSLPKEGSPEDVAHFWYAQMPASHRNVDGLKAVRAKQAAELDRIISGKALEDLKARGATVKIAGLPKRQEDLATSIAQLDQAIKKAPKPDPKVIAAVHALSRDRQAVLEQAGLLTPERAAARRGIVADWLGVKPTGEEAFIGHRLDRVRGAQESLVPASAGVGKARIPEGVTKENKLVRARYGQVRMSTHVAREDWQAAQTYRQATRARDDLGKMGRSFDGRIDWKTERLVNPRGRPVPPEWKTDRLAKLDEQGHNDEELRKAAEQIVSGFLAKNKAEAGDLIKAAQEHGVDWDELRVVPKRTVDRYYEQFTRPQGASAVGKVYDRAVDATAASIIFGRVGYIPKNVAQNIVMSVPHQGVYFAANAPRAAQVLKDANLRHLIGAEVGTGATGALGQEFASKVRGIPSKITNAVSGVADTPFRISAFLHEAAAEGVISKLNPHLTEKDKHALIELLTDPAKRPQLNDIGQRAVEAMADFSRMTPTQRKLARRLFVIPGWLVAGSRYPVHFAATHPIRSGALAYAAAGEPGAPDRFQVNKPINEYFAKGLPSFVQGVDTGGGKVFRTTSLSPVNTPWDIAGAIAGRKDAGTVADYANPLGGALWHIANRELSGRTGSYRTSYKKAILGNLERLAPSEKFARDMISPTDNPRTYPEDTSLLGRLKREVGVIPIKISRDTPKAQQQAAAAKTLLKKLGLGSDLPAPVKKSYTRLAERDAAWKDATHGKKAGTRDYYVAKYKADLELAQKWGYLNAAQVAKAQEWIGHAPVDDIRKAHSALSDDGGIYDKEFTPTRETTRWLEAQDKYSSDLDEAVKHGDLTKEQAARGRAWAKKASHGDIDKARVALERRLLAPIG